MGNFDKASKDWDKNLKRVERAKDVAKEILKILPNTLLRGLEYGSGTGLLGFELLKDFKEIDFYDTSKGMLERVAEKIEEKGVSNCNIVEKLDKNTSYDCLFNLMVLHHIPNRDEVFKEWNTLINKGGYLCIADLVTEDGSFHSNTSDSDTFNGPHGFDTKELSKELEEKGFKVISITVPHIIDKNDKEYPVFLMIAEKI